MALRITRGTGITLSVSVIAGIVLIAVAWARADTNLRRDLRDLRDLAQENQGALTNLGESLKQLSVSVERIKDASSDRWTRTHMRKLVKEWGRANPELTLPDVDEIAWEPRR